MSDTELNTGKLVPTHMNKQKALDLCGAGYENIITDDPDTWVDALNEAVYDEVFPQFIRLNGRWFRVDNHVRTTELDGCTVSENQDGTIDFHCVHYNGSGTWSEIVEEKIRES